MATKKQKSTKSAAKKATISRTHKKGACRTNCKRSCNTISNAERMHICIVTVLSITAGILLCIDAAMMIV